MDRRQLLSAALTSAGLAAIGGPRSTAQSAAPNLPGSIWDVRQFGAKGDSTTLDTATLQAAIDACAQAGGGFVFFPKGTYLSGSLILKNNVTLYLAPEATLLGSPDGADYPAHPYIARDRDTGGYEVEALIYAEGASNIGIEGPGIIDGNGKTFPKRKVTNPEVSVGKRPRLLYWRNCHNVRIRDVTLRNSSCWTAHFVLCDKLVLQGIAVFSDLFINQDGIDIDSCQNTVVSDCFVDTVDDAIVIKSSHPQPTKNLTITNCVLTTQCGAIKFGSQSVGGFNNISISNCAIYEAGMGGVKIEAVDGGDLEDIAISNLVMHNVAAPISILLGNRAEHAGFPDLTLPRPISRLRNIVITGIRATVADEGDKWRRGATCLIAGIPGHPIQGLTISDVSITYPGGATPAEADRLDIPEHENEYPDNTMFGVLPAYAFYLRHVRGISLNNVRIELATPDPRSALIAEDVEDLELTGFRAAGSGDHPLIRLRNTQGALLQGCRALDPCNIFLQVDGNSSDIALLANDLRKVKTITQSGDGFTGKIAQSGNLTAS